MASRSQVDQALQAAVDRLAEVDPKVRRRVVAERTVACDVLDLGLTWSGRLCEDGLADVAVQETEALADGNAPQLRLRVGSDDLVALTEGRLPVTAAWASGRLQVDASMLDLLKLRALL